MSKKRNATKQKRTTKPFEGVWFLFKVCWRYDKWYLFLLLAGEVLSYVTTVLTLLIPGRIIDAMFPQPMAAGTSQTIPLVDRLIDRIAPMQDAVSNPQRALLFLAALVVITLITGLLQTLISNRLSVEKSIVYKKFQLDLSRKIMTVRYERTETAEFLDLKARAEQFITTGGAGFGATLDTAFGLIGNMVLLVKYALVLWGILKDFPLILLIVVLTSMTIVLNYILSKKNIEINIEKSMQDRRAGYFSLLTQHFKFGKEIRGNGCDEWVNGRYEKQLNLLQRFYEKLARYGIKFGILMLLVMLVQKGVTYWYLIRRSLGFGISAGNFSICLNAAEAFSGGLKSVVGGIASINQYNKYYEAFKEYYALSDIDNAITADTVKMPDIESEMVIRFNDVTFKYPGTNYEALSHVSCEIDRGDIVSIVGDNGAGKSTFIKLLLRLYEPTSGTITINGVDASKIDRREYAKYFACVFQDFQLLSFSLKDNISLGEHETDPNGEAKIDEAIAFAGLTEKVESLEKGKDTMIYREFDDNGYTPSGGEGQRLALARAIYRDSEILILDEPTAALDPNIEYELNQRIRSRLHGKKTIINVSHRLHSVRFSNKIFVFRAGKLIESGTHETLFTRPTVYRQMFERQASDYVDMSSLE